MNLAQSIEAFHNGSHSGRYLPKSVYKKYVRKPLEEAIKLIPDFTDADSEQEQLDLKRASQFCTLAVLRSTKSLGLSLLWVMFLQKWNTPDLKEYKKILKEEKLSHLNSYSLRDRLEEIVNEHIDCLPDHFFNSQEDRDIFLKQVRKTRNYLTHLSKKDQYVAEGKELRKLCMRLKVVLEICLLKKLGLEDNQIKTIIFRYR